MESIHESGSPMHVWQQSQETTSMMPSQINNSYHLLSTISPDYVSEEVDIAVIIMLLIVSVTGTSGNLLTILAVITHPNLRKMSNVYILNLAVVDLTVSLFLTPISVHTMLHNVQPPGCSTVLPFISMLCTTVSLLNLSAIAVNRYIAIVRGKRIYLKHYTKVKVAASIIVIWLFGGLVSMPPLLGFGEFGYDIKFGICFIPPGNPNSYWYTFCICVVFTLPFLVCTVFAYTNIIRKFRKTQINMRRHSISGSRTLVGVGTYHQRASTDALHEILEKPRPLDPASVKTCSPMSPNPEQISQRMQKQQLQMFKVAFNCIVVWIFYILVWIPIICLHIFDFDRLVPAKYYRVLFAVAYTNFAINAFIYAVLNRNFRQAYRNLLCCSSCDKSDKKRSSSFKTEYSNVSQSERS
ncbi:tyramine receptor Ser-2-like [Liolophura sinensis]|uniref:tyramine receptor Ser-2-like n=1 Tax=Liolophura sinensis TaxID=3198878 RepID=UPI003158F29F